MPNNAPKSPKLSLHKTTIRSLSVRTKLRTGLSGSDACTDACGGGGGGGGGGGTDGGGGGGSIVLNDSASGVTRTKTTGTCACGVQ